MATTMSRSFVSGPSALYWRTTISVAAGAVAAAVALSQDTSLRGVDIRRVQDILVEQDVPLPRNEKFLAIDKGYQELVEEKKHGLYTKLAEANKLADPYIIYIGQILTVPAK